MIQAYGIAEKKIVVILNGVDHKKFNPSLRSDVGKRTRRELGIKSNARVVLFVGTGFRRKGLDRLLRLWRAGAMPNVYLLVVGGDTRLAAYRSAWRHNPYVIFAGPKPNVEDYYVAADVLAFHRFKKPSATLSWRVWRRDCR
jgi:UDP-glucose:(heptosyl)LPS alpha-1,3-glucosyltransferase